MATKDFENLIDLDDLAVYDEARCTRNDAKYETKTDAAAKANVVEGAKIGTADATVDSDKNLLLGTAAGASTTDFDEAGAAAGVLGTSDDADTANTVFGAKKYADTQKNAAVTAVTGNAETDTADSLTLNGLKKKVDALGGEGGSVAQQITTAIGKLDSSVTAETGKVITAFEIEDGKIKAESTQKMTVGTAAAADTESTLTDGANLPTGAAVKSFVETKGYQTASDVASAVEAYGYQTASEVAAAVAGAGHLKKAVVDSVPGAAEADADTLYYVMNAETGYYDIYQKIGEEVVRLDDVSVNLSGYAQSSDFSIASRDAVVAIVTGGGE